MFTQKDILQIQDKGITLDQIEAQINMFQKGFPFVEVVKPAFYDDGILLFVPDRVKELGSLYRNTKKDFRICKFVPASGAATRMFKNLYSYLDNPQTIDSEVEKFLSNIKSFAFYPDLQNKALEIGSSIDHMEPTQIIDLLLSPKGLNYGNLPKGLIKFHSYDNESRVPIEEHIVEGALYATSSNNDVFIHFTLSPEHILPFNRLINSVIEKYQKIYSVKLNISYSIQKASTDTIAVDKQNKPFREKDGTLVFRPGGHGALLENLNDLDSDIIFVKNIDNVLPDRLKATTVEYKNALAGLLIETHLKICEYIHYLISDDSIGYQKNQEIKNFIESRLGYIFPDKILNLPVEDKKELLFHILNRPLRVCGMVKNEGEPGGGPYWVKSSDGSLSLQILESSQFNSENKEQQKIFKSATHFNPVDLVVYTKDYKRQKFDLKRYTNPETGFISIKSKDGKDLKALELPGLWNGAMANWNTIFIEVPLITFNPVKIITDLLREEHRS